KGLAGLDTADQITIQFNNALENDRFRRASRIRPAQIKDVIVQAKTPLTIPSTKEEEILLKKLDLEAFIVNALINKNFNRSPTESLIHQQRTRIAVGLFGLTVLSANSCSINMCEIESNLTEAQHRQIVGLYKSGASYR
ncbi:620_t:CDS:2, partial [Entrophospora sp. SA101]